MDVLIFFGCFQVGITIESLIRLIMGCDGKSWVFVAYDTNGMVDRILGGCFSLHNIYERAVLVCEGCGASMDRQEYDDQSYEGDAWVLESITGLVYVSQNSL